MKASLEFKELLESSSSLKFQRISILGKAPASIYLIAQSLTHPIMSGSSTNGIENPSQGSCRSQPHFQPWRYCESFVELLEVPEQLHEASQNLHAETGSCMQPCVCVCRHTKPDTPDHAGVLAAEVGILASWRCNLIMIPNQWHLNNPLALFFGCRTPFILLQATNSHLPRMLGR